MVDTGRIEEGQNLILESTRLMAELYESTENPSFEKMLDVAISLGHQSTLAVALENTAEAGRLNLEAIRILIDVVSRSPDFARGRYEFASALIQYWQLNETLPQSEWLNQVEDYSLSDQPLRSCDLADLAVRQAVMRGDLASAKSYTDYLLNKQYREPGFMGFCEAYGLCS